MYLFPIGWITHQQLWGSVPPGRDIIWKNMWEKFLLMRSVPTCVYFPLRRHHSGKTKVAKFDDPQLGDKNVFWLDITMDNLEY